MHILNLCSPVQSTTNILNNKLGFWISPAKTKGQTGSLHEPPLLQGILCLASR